MNIYLGGLNRRMSFSSCPEFGVHRKNDSIGKIRFCMPDPYGNLSIIAPARSSLS